MSTVRPLMVALPFVLAPSTPVVSVAPIGTPAVPALATTIHAVPTPPTAPAAARPRTLVGPPWLSIEHPVNPYDPTTRDAFLVVHAFHHGTPVAFPVVGSAEGIVNGERRSVALSFTRTTRTGAFALSRQWPNEGVWTLVVSVRQGPTDSVTAVVDLSPGGEVAAVRIPTRRQDGHTIPAPVSMAAVEASLRERAARRSVSREE